MKTGKTIAVLMICAVMLLLAGCGEQQKAVDVDVKGTWRVNNVGQFVAAVLSVGGDTVKESDLPAELVSIFSIRFMFEEDGNATLLMTMEGEEEPGVYPYTWEMKDGSLYLDGEQIPCRLSGQELILTLSLDELSSGQTGKTMDLHMTKEE